MLVAYEAQIVGLLLAFARIGTLLMFVPGFGEARVPPQHRLLLGVILSLGLLPSLPLSPPQSVPLLAVLLAREALIGLYLGAGSRILFAALHSLGGIISNATSLSNAMAAGDTGYEGSTAVSGLLTAAGVALVFITDTHHLMLRGLMASYTAMPVGVAPLGDFADQILRLAVKSLSIAVMLGAPFFVLGILLNLGLGLANRVLPSLPVFFIAGPLIIMLGLWVLWLSQGAILAQFQDSFAEFFLYLRP